MKKLILAATICVLCAPVLAQTAAPAPDYTFTGNLAVTTDYRFRGISQTYKQPAIQGGFDFAHASGFYLGNWNSNVSGNSFNNGASIEMDFYGGYKFEVAKDTMLDLGVLYYYYPGASLGNTGEKYNNTELYVGASYQWLSAKYSYAVTDFFGINNKTYGGDDSKGSSYLDLNANFEVYEKTVLNLHVGHQWVKNYGVLDYTDYKIGLTRDFGFASVGLAVIATNADKNQYFAADSNGKVKRTGRTAAVLTVSKTF
jgi:uncharacterized protein (TIGR02001 family)